MASILTHRFREISKIAAGDAMFGKFVLLPLKEVRTEAKKKKSKRTSF